MCDNELNIVSLKADFVGASLYKICDSLVSYSALIDGNTLLVKIVVADGISDTEEEHLHDILGDIVGNYDDVCGDFTLVKVDSARTALDVDLLPILLFHKAV